MASAIVPDLLELFADELVVVPGVSDAYGDFVASGQEFAVPAYIEGDARLVRDASGREVVSSMQVYVGGVFDLTVDGHRYTLPARYDPNALLQAIRVDKAQDENGAHHETVVLP